jgi:hypothetical protein
VNPANFERALRSFTRRRRFQPFMIQMITGEELRIPHPEAIVMRGELIVFVAPKDKYRLFDSTSVSQIHDVMDL